MRVLEKSVMVAAAPAAVWDAWTTREGIASFFAPDAHVELRPGGAYEIRFMPDAPPGERGADGCRVLSLLPGAMLSFDWNAPPSLPTLRPLGPLTWVVVTFTPEGDQTRVALTQLGWREGEDWQAMYAYFDRAWGVVLDRLARRFVDGPIDWAADD